MSEPQTPDPRSEALPTCRCGHTREHAAVEAEPVYGGFVFLLGVMFGMGGSKPKSVRFRCTQCHEVIEESTAPEVWKRKRARAHER